MSPENLLLGVEFLAVCIVIIVASIYIQLFRKKRHYFYTSNINRHLENWISHILLEESAEGIQLPAKFYRILRNPAARVYAIDELVKCKKNFSGTVAETVVQLYTQLGLKKDSLKKLSSRKWYVKARGIQELYLMDQMDVLKTIYKNTNNRHEFVRMEAQTGIIYLSGFPGLRFLDVISYPLTEWQQIKLLEQLRLTPQKQDLTEFIPRWLQSKNDTVVVFALKLADEYQLFAIIDDVVDCLVHPSDRVRTQAVKTLVKLADHNTPGILLGYFRKEKFTNRSLMLDALATMATEAQTDILLSLLDEENNIIKLKAAIVLANCSPNGMGLLEQRAISEPEPYLRILKHVKSVK
ncbi:MAG: hypothetical protein JO301_16285 [Chitinophagaceae bacterium]|nr:hypothetical protein [Chitinophagaceae bacterium]